MGPTLHSHVNRTILPSKFVPAAVVTSLFRSSSFSKGSKNYKFHVSRLGSKAAQIDQFTFFQRFLLKMWLLNPCSGAGELRKPTFWKALAAEFVGTGFLVFVGCGAAVTSNSAQGTDAFVVRVALTFGLTVATMVWCIASVSGGHINPAVTIAFLVTRKISLIGAVLYMIFQCAGAIVGAGLLFVATDIEVHEGGFGCNGIGIQNQTTGELVVNGGQAILIEALITFVLIFTVFATCDSKRGDLKGSGPLAIGIAVLICHLAVIPITGSSMNPARSLGPAVIHGGHCWDNHYVYWVGPPLGGAIAGLVYDLIFSADSSLRKLCACASSDDYDPESCFDSEKEQLLSA